MENFAQEKRRYDIREQYAPFCGGVNAVSDELIDMHVRATHALNMMGGRALTFGEMATLAAVAGCVLLPGENPPPPEPAEAADPAPIAPRRAAAKRRSKRRKALTVHVPESESVAA